MTYINGESHMVDSNRIAAKTYTIVVLVHR
jgi:hypothetical protein